MACVIPFFVSCSIIYVTRVFKISHAIDVAHFESLAASILPLSSFSSSDRSPKERAAGPAGCLCVNKNVLSRYRMYFRTYNKNGITMTSQSGPGLKT